MALRSGTYVPLAGLVCAVLLAGCSKAPEPSGSSSTPGAAQSSSSGSSATPSESDGTVTPTLKPSLGGVCEDLLPVSKIDSALGRPIIGTTAFIMGIPEPTIGRLVYLNCKYGVIKPARGKPAAAPKIEIGVSLYNSPAQASKRVKGTIEDYRSHGSSQVDTVAGKLPATILLGYGHPTLVAVAGPRSVAVTVDSKFSGTRRNNDLRAVAAVVLESTAHFIAASPSASESPSATSTS